MKALALATILALAATQAAAEPCRTKSGDGYRSWRIIDGKRCWTKGRRAKASLYWAQAKPVEERHEPKKYYPEEDDVWPKPEAAQAPKTLDRVPVELTPQQRIDRAFQCLQFASRGYRCE